MIWRTRIVTLWPLWVGLLCAFVAWSLVRGYTEQMQRDFQEDWFLNNPPEETVDVLVFRKPQYSGTQIALSDLQYRALPRHSLPSDVIYAADVDALMGLELTLIHGQTIEPGHPLVWAYFREITAPQELSETVKYTVALTPEQTHLGYLNEETVLLLYHQSHQGMMQRIGSYPIVAYDGETDRSDQPRAPRYLTVAMSLADRLGIEGLSREGQLFWVAAPVTTPPIDRFGEPAPFIEFLFPGGKQCEHGCSPSVSYSP
ncbi:SAF domain-containing protein [Aliidiomarina sanyensis]|uniref:Uncharacterized protein n=1 Tax=Aliidiomarina sanyensis TaxID=1249555 RepID=A0A432WEN5_9GAMM|nr:SAF domain-containing protein [Aliidiomarina sanyensis]RUO31341.1 hypothetical protein CWE11_08320 [Aliidiomarina sanyensis]